MICRTAYKVKIKHYNHIFNETLNVYRELVSYFIDICIKEWDDLSKIEYLNYKKDLIEKLTHRTKSNLDPKYSDYDTKFGKIPSNFRRAAIRNAVGLVSLYKGDLKRYKDGVIKYKPSAPKVGNSFPYLFKETYKRIDDYNASIKIRRNNIWKWVNVELNKHHVNYILKNCKYDNATCPRLYRKGKEWFLTYMFDKNVSLSNVSVSDQCILAVDLGINTPATMSVMKSDGSIVGRYFCHLNNERNKLIHIARYVRKFRRLGNTKLPKLCARLKGLNKDISIKTAKSIIDVAFKHKVDTIVFEHLGAIGKKQGKKQFLSLWKGRDIQHMVAYKAHKLGVHITTVCANGTSSLAFDGSGPIVRDKDNATNCTFANGKRYNCDLSASYNIGARYFIREILKPLDKNSRLAIEAKVPQCAKRSTCTLSTLITLNAELKSRKL